MVTFIGIHYKEGKKALDSSTFSGRRIDSVINRLACKTVKANLFQTLQLPKKPFSENTSIVTFLEPEGIFVLLGKNVQKYFPYDEFPNVTILKFRHPSFSKSDYSDKLHDEIIKLNPSLNRVGNVADAV